MKNRESGNLNSRREFLKITGLGGLAMAMPGGMSAAEPRWNGDLPRPNILWISTEDISPDLGCYGDAYARSPHIDRFSEEGTRFLRTFSHAGVCAPARSGIITGMYPTTIGTHHMRCKGVPPPQARCFTEILRAEGYYCSNNVKTDYQFDAPLTAWDDCSGKAHWRNREAGQPFFSVINITTTHESRIRSRNGKLLERIAELEPGKKHDPAGAKLPPFYPDTPITRRDWAQYADIITLMDLEVGSILGQLEEDGLREDTIVWFFSDHGRGLPRAKRWIYDSGIHVPLIIRVPERFRKLADASNPAGLESGTSNDDLVSFIDFGPTVLSLAGLEAPDAMQGRPFLGPMKAAPRRMVFAARDRMDEAYDLIRAVRDRRFKYIRNFMHHLTYGQDIEFMNQMPTMQEMRRLNGLGGLKGAEKRYFLHAKPVEELYDTRTDPHEIVNLAGKQEYADRVSAMRTELYAWMRKTRDVGLIPEPDFDELKCPGGVWQKTAKPGFSLEEGHVEGAFLVLLSCPTPGASIAYRIRSGKKRSAWKLYNAPVRLEAGRVLVANACRLGFIDSDELQIDGHSPGAKKSPPPAPPHWQDCIPAGLLDRLLAVKALDGQGAEAVPRYMKALEDPEGPVRYWGVIGLHAACRKDGVADEIVSALLERLSDSSPSVAIAAAEALCEFGKERQALPRLIEALNSPRETVRLFAVSSLYRIGEKARPAIDSIKAAAGEKSQYVPRVARHILRRLDGG
jgi:uncharacterized sulfatase